MAAWRCQFPLAPDLTMSVNVSGRQLEHDHFVTDVDDVLKASGIPPALLTLEITESFFIRDFQAAVGRLRALKRLGIRLAIDDFGTGFSSLFSLSRLPVDTVKIDKAFIDGLGTRYDAVVSAVVTMGNAFDLQVVAEGIEHRSQRDRLVELGCRFAQGFYFSMPLTIADVELVLQRMSKSPISVQ
jgi:EAL domain-containing protein (putative c-di-GMP-specific phosphodiesterase class I)